MQIYHTLIFFEEGKGEIFTCDTIYYEGKYWLVHTWLDLPDRTRKRPERIVCLSDLEHQPSAQDWKQKGVDFFLNAPLPKSVFDAQIPPHTFSGYTILNFPDVEYPFGLA